ncbi:MAG: hypothetical protein GX847_00005 [Clostridiales bacterium]|nr:hypothetical protein [Clostridiales bacterium]
MLNYEKLYRILFNGITDAIDTFEREGYENAREVLMKAQQAAEEYFISGEEEEDENDPPSGGVEAMPLYVVPQDRL